MAAGAPVVCSDLPGYREAAGEAARFVPPGDPRALAVALRELLTDSVAARALSEGGRRRAEKLDWRLLGRDVVACYEAAVSP